MTLNDLLQELEVRRIQLSVADGKLKFTAPQHAVDAATREALKEHKPALLELFADTSNRPAVVDDGGAQMPAPASMAQRRMWFLAELGMPAELYAVHFSWHCRGTLDIDVLRQSIDRLVRRHRVLRTRIVGDGDEVLQIVDEHRPFELDVQPVNGNPPDWQSDASALFGKPFDLGADVLLRGRLYELAHDHHVLCLVTHHIAMDGWSAGVFKQELGTVYQALLSGREPQLAPINRQYSAYANEQQNLNNDAKFINDLATWKRQLAGELPTLALPFDRPRPNKSTYTGASVIRQVPVDVMEPLQALARHQGTTLFVVLLAVFKAFLYRYSGERDVLVGTPVANRDHVDWHALVGFFVNNVVLRVHVDPDASFLQLLSTVKSTRQQSLAIESVPFESLVQALQPTRHLSINPLFQIMFLMQNASGTPLLLPGVELQPIEHIGRQTAKFDLAMEVRPCEANAGYEYNLNYSTDLFDEGSVVRMADCFDTFMAAISETPERSIAATRLLAPNECDRLLHEFNDTTRPLPAEKTIDELFRRQLRATPDAVALIDATGHSSHKSGQQLSVSYRVLAARALDIQMSLHAAGCSAGDVVCIAIERSSDFIAAVIGVLQAGAVWCPLDPTYPTERLAYMFADSGASLLLQRKSTSLVGNIGDAHLIAIDEQVPFYTRALHATDAAEQAIPHPLPVLPAGGVLEHQRHSAGAAYLIYTSGSTGSPKGVFGTHIGAVNRLAWMWDAYPFADHDVACIKTAVSFVDSIWESFGALLQGVPSVVVGSAAQDPAALLRLLHEHGVSRLVCVPSLLVAMLEHAEPELMHLPELTLCISSGESLPSSLASKVYAAFPGITLLNLYGSSEVAADVTCHEFIQASDHIQLPIGKPIANTHVHIVDEHRNLVPPGVLGELYISGRGVALGYHEAGVELQAKFSANTIADSAGHETLFRTGDRGYWTTDGEIVCVGRMDRQIKVRGIRIDCGEVEALLQQHPSVRACHVYAQNQTISQSLHAAVVADTGVELTYDDLSRFVAERAPAWLMPATVVVTDKLPKLPNGKIDLAGLKRVSEQQARSDVTAVRPETELERELLGIWRQVLGRESIGVTDNFFSIGGHSLLAVRLLKRMQPALGRALPLSVIFEVSTIRDLAAFASKPVQPASARSLMVLQQKNHVGQYVFLMPPNGHTGIYFQGLLEHMPDSVGVYSFDPVPAMEHISIDSIAEHYAEEILDVQPAGPWILGGACLGNHLALATANALQTITGTPSRLFLIDSDPPFNGPGWEHASGTAARRRSPLHFYAGVLLSAWRHDKFHSLGQRQKRRIHALFNDTVNTYNNVQYHLSALFVRYMAKSTESTITLFLSEELLQRPWLLPRWKAMTTADFVWHQSSAISHRELVDQKSPYWADYAAMMLDQTDVAVKVQHGAAASPTFSELGR